MTNEEIRDFALKLLHADSESQVIQILKDAGYWDDRSAWRLYGDKEGNFAQVGNQQSLPEAALVEKITNCIDSRLLLECLKRGIDPESEDAPCNLRDAVAMFFEGRRAKDNEAGMLVNWSSKRRNEESHKITIAATGGKPTRGKKTKKMCLTICDEGEGQSPQRLPDTILSLNKKNKQRIRFVQGKFNMGGSGALRFCGTQGIQLVISKQNASLTNDSDPTTGLWGVTVVRREEPSNKSGDPIHSEFTYLAPIGSDQSPRGGAVLSFSADELPLMPEANRAYARSIPSGTAIKLYEYETTVSQSNVLFKDGLMYALERLLPEIALPIRIHECRPEYDDKDKKTTPASFHTPIAGLVTRLEDGKGKNLEPGFPLSETLFAAGTKMTARIYAFQEDKAETYLKHEGVIFEINGQAHGHIRKSIFARPKKVALPRLKDSLLVIVDCSALTATQREDLFMSSRDRLSEKAIRVEVEEEIMDMLRNNSKLKELQQERREKDIESKLSEQRPLEEVLGKVLKASPTLKTLFLQGQRLPKPFDKGGSGGSGEDEGEGGGADRNQKEKKPFKGRRHPTFFQIKGISYGQVYQRNCEIGRRSRIAFKTDVENEYFKRATDRGTFELEILDNEDLEIPRGNFSLEDGDAFLNFSLPDNVEVGDSFTLQTTVTDPTLMEPFVNVIRIRVLQKRKHPPSPPRPKPDKKGSGSGSKGTSLGISLPNVITVKTEDEHWKRHHFTPETACHVETDPVKVDGKNVDEHTFYINVDNTSLLTEMKYSKKDVRVIEAKFKYANVLLGLAMLHADAHSGGGTNGESAVSIQDEIRKTTAAVAPVVIPMIDQLSGLDESELEAMFSDDD